MKALQTSPNPRARIAPACRLPGFISFVLLAAPGCGGTVEPEPSLSTTTTSGSSSSGSASSSGTPPGDAACLAESAPFAVYLRSPEGLEYGRNSDGSSAADNTFPPKVVQGRIVASSSDSLSIDACVPDSGCQPLIWQLDIATDNLTLHVPTDALVELWFQSTELMQTAVMLRPLATWGGLVNGVATPPLLLLVQLRAIADPDHPEVNPLDVNLDVVDCSSEPTPNVDIYAWRIASKDDPYKLIIVPKSESPISWRNGPFTFTARNLGTYYSHATERSEQGLWVTGQ